MPHTLIVTPAGQSPRQGNQVTATRWAGILRSLGHRVQLANEFNGQPTDLLVALHARKSAAAIKRFARHRPDAPIIVALTGTDLYRDIHTSKAAQRSLDLATRLVLLQPHGQGQLPDRLHSRVHVIYQSAEPPAQRPSPLSSVFEIVVSGHLRGVKDPFRAALASRRLPARSHIRITHIGGALTHAMAERAWAEMQRNSRYRWVGEVARSKARSLLARSRLLVVTSRMEGGANVIAEALAASVPILSSRISGSVGLLGEDYPGYFEVGDTRALATLMQRCEEDGAFYRSLRRQCRKRRGLVRPSRERASWRRLVDEVLRY